MSLEKKIIVLADDFSGAAEMAGIGYRYGLNTDIQLSFDPASEASLIVVDTNTRLLTKENAITITQAIAEQLLSTGYPIALFKKVDSVMRGHIAAETDVLQRSLGFDRIILLPANPSRSRVIRSGNYYIKESSLEDTVFAKDPDFPIRSGNMALLLKHNDNYLPHIHIKRGDPLPSSAFITADIESAADLRNYIQQTASNDLCVGAAECFEAFLEKQGYEIAKRKKIDDAPPAFTLIINGSTVRDPEEKKLLTTLQIPVLSLPGQWTGDEFRLDDREANRWHDQVLDAMITNRIAAVEIDHPVKQVPGQATVFSTHFVKLMQYISERITHDGIHFCLTGGATASALIERLGKGKLCVEEEVAPGIVTLTREKKLFTVKPGSYAWPVSFLEKLSIHQSNRS